MVCGDHMATSTLNGALESGVNAGNEAAKIANKRKKQPAATTKPPKGTNGETKAEKRPTHKEMDAKSDGRPSESSKEQDIEPVVST